MQDNNDNNPITPTPPYDAEKVRLRKENLDLKLNRIVQSMHDAQQKLEQETTDKCLRDLPNVTQLLINEQYTQAIALLRQMSSYKNKTTAIQKNIDTVFANCKKVVTDKVQALVKEANALLDAHDKDAKNIRKAESKRSEALELQRNIDGSESTSLATLSTRIYWFQNRRAYNEKSKRILQQISTNKCLNSDFIKSFKNHIKVYKTAEAFHDSDEESLYEVLSRKLEQLQNITIQQNIHQNLLPEVAKYLLAGKLLEANRCMQTCRSEAIKITNQADVENYTSPDSFTKSIEILSVQVNAFEKRRNRETEDISKRIIDQAVKRRCDEFGSGNKFYEQEKQALYSTLSGILGDYWHKFDEQGVPEELSTALSDIIASGLKQTNVISRYYYWTDADVWCADIKSVQASIRDLVAKHSTAIEVAPVAIDLPILPDLSSKFDTRLELHVRDVLLPKAVKYEEECKWEYACKTYELCLQVMRKIKNQSTFANSQVPTAEKLRKHMDELKIKIENFNHNRQSMPGEISSSIIKQAVAKKCEELCVGKKLYQLEAKRLQTKFNSVLAQNWHKFDGRDFPKGLSDAIQQIIYDNLKMARVVSKFFYWTDADVWFADISSVEAQIQKAIEQYVPRRNYEHVLKID